MASAFRKTLYGMGWPKPEDIEPAQSYSAESIEHQEIVRPFPFPEVVAEPKIESQPDPKQDSQRIVTIAPVSFEEACQIGDTFREGTPVIINLSGMSEASARRIVDFISGLAHGLRGSLSKVTERVFLLSPQEVKVLDAPKQAKRDLYFAKTDV